MNNITLADYIKDPSQYWWKTGTINIAGADIGRRGNPSHLSVFAITSDFTQIDKNGDPLEILTQIHQKFLDSWEYTRQVEYFTKAVEYFNISKLYYDATRGDLDERGLPRNCVPIILSNRTGPKAKGKLELATNFAKLIEQKRIKLLNDDRFLAQITCVDNMLNAPNTPAGHGDSFISVMLAVGAYFDYYAKDRKLGTIFLGNLTEVFNKSETLTNRIDSNRGKTNIPIIIKDDIKCKICGNRIFIDLGNGKKKCDRCMTVW